MKDDLGLSALVRTAHEYAAKKAASRKEWVVSVAAARALNAALDALAIAAENYARAAAEVFKVDGPSAASAASPQQATAQPEMAVWCAVCEGTMEWFDDDGERVRCTESKHEGDTP